MRSAVTINQSERGAATAPKELFPFIASSAFIVPFSMGQSLWGDCCQLVFISTLARGSESAFTHPSLSRIIKA